MGFAVCVPLWQAALTPSWRASLTKELASWPHPNQNYEEYYGAKHVIPADPHRFKQERRQTKQL